MAEALYSKPSDAHDVLSAAGALASGEVQQLADGRAAVVAGLNAVSTGDPYALQAVGIIGIVTAAATTFSKGDSVMWDASASLAVNRALTLDGSADFRLGIAAQDCSSSQTVVYTELNAVAPGNAVPLAPIVFEFDCATGSDTDAHVIIPAEQNPHGLVITHIFGLITEAFVGSSEDQGVITISDESNNALATLTPTDGASDAIGDYILGVQAQSTATGAATILQVAAGEFIDGAVTTQTAGGTPAGKVKVYIEAIPLI